MKQKLEALLTEGGVVYCKSSQLSSVGRGKSRKVSVTFEAKIQTKNVLSNNHNTDTCSPVRLEIIHNE